MVPGFTMLKAVKAQWSNLNSGCVLVWWRLDEVNKMEVTLLSNKELQMWSKQALMHGPWPHTHTLFTLIVLTVLGKNIPNTQLGQGTLNYICWSYHFQFEGRCVWWLLFKGHQQLAPSLCHRSALIGPEQLHAHVSLVQSTGCYIRITELAHATGRET